LATWSGRMRMRPIGEFSQPTIPSFRPAARDCLKSKPRECGGKRPAGVSRISVNISAWFSFGAGEVALRPNRAFLTWRNFTEVMFATSFRQLYDNPTSEPQRHLIGQSPNAGAVAG
jgi:hypothetical protein